MCLHPRRCWLKAKGGGRRVFARMGDLKSGAAAVCMGDPRRGDDTPLDFCRLEAVQWNCCLETADIKEIFEAEPERVDDYNVQNVSQRVTRCSFSSFEILQSLQLSSNSMASYFR